MLVDLLPLDCEPSAIVCLFLFSFSLTSSKKYKHENDICFALRASKHPPVEKEKMITQIATLSLRNYFPSKVISHRNKFLFSP